MGAARLGLLLSALLIIGLASGLDASGNPIIPVPQPVDYLPHDPIVILSDDEFTEENGVSEGNGTEFDPYVIEAWIITPFHEDEGVRIENTAAFFKVVNVIVQYDYNDSISGSSGVVGMRFENCSVGRVASCYIENAETGILITDCSNFVVFYNSLQGGFEQFTNGIDVGSSIDVDIRQNIVSNWYCAILEHRSEEGRIEDNKISNAQVGVNLRDCSGVLVGANTFEATVTEYIDDSWSDNIWPEAQDVAGSDDGLILLLGVVIPADAALLMLGLLRLRRT